MGLTVQSNSIVMKDSVGNVRFSTDREMPHLLHVASGTMSMGDVSGVAHYIPQISEYGGTYVFNGFTASTVTRHTAVSNSSIITGSDAFVAPFITLSAGVFQTPSGQVMSALGSNVVHLYIRDDGYYVGSTIINVEINAGKVELVARSEVSLSGNYQITNHSYTNSTPPYTGGGNVSVPSTLSGTGFNVTYKIYYGRFN
jgi:hypothetical protein